MKAALQLSRMIDAVNRFIGEKVSWLILVAVLLSAGNALSRKFLDLSNNALLELQWYLFGTVFLFAAAYTLLKNEHVRIDIVANQLSKRKRDWIDLFGHLFFLLPFCVLMIYICTPWFYKSLVSGELTPNSGSLYLWPAKLIILLGFVFLGAQAISQAIKRVAVISGVSEDDMPAASHDGEDEHV